MTTTDPPAAAILRECAYPERCGSDGKSCCHPECRWSPEKQAQREHLRGLTQLSQGVCGGYR